MNLLNFNEFGLYLAQLLNKQPQRVARQRGYAGVGFNLDDRCQQSDIVGALWANDPKLREMTADRVDELRPLNDVDPLAWMPRTLERTADRWPISQVDQLMPWNLKS